VDHRQAINSLKPIFRFPMRDKDSANRFLVGSALSLAGFLIPILPSLLAYGYAIRVMRQTATGDSPSMPAWDDWNAYIKDGVRGALVSFACFFPAFLVFLLGFGLYLAAFIALAMADSGGSQSYAAFASLALLATAALFVALPIGSILLFLGAIPLPLATAHFAIKDSLAAAFRIREWLPILRANKLGYFISWVIVAGLFGMTYLVFFTAYYTLILICLLPFLMAPAVFYTMLVVGALFGNVYHESALAIEPEPLAAESGSQVMG